MPRSDEASSAAIQAAIEWYEEHRGKGGHVNTNVMTSGIAIAELLRESFPLGDGDVRSARGSQVRGLSGSLIKRVLKAHGESRPFSAEGGRTSRGTLPIAMELARRLNAALEPFDLDSEQIDFIADKLQDHFVRCIRLDFFDKKRLEVVIDPEKPVAAIIDDIFEAARQRSDQPSGTVAQHLVGAKLELRFPELDVGRDKANAADQQTDRQGDFQLGNTAFHVTMAPSSKLTDRVRENLRNGYRPFILVPGDKVTFAIGLFISENLDDRVNVESIESFIGSTIEELGFFESEGIRAEIVHLIHRYNERIQACETDQSLKIEEPEWMNAYAAPAIHDGIAECELDEKRERT